LAFLRRFPLCEAETASLPWIPPCTLSAEELASTVPSEQTLRRMRAARD
jgi:hypothetical protein